MANEEHRPEADIEVWFNPSCSKSRGARDELTALDTDFVLRDYRQDSPSIAELEAVLAKLSAQPWDICRLNEQVAKDLGMAEWPRDADNRDRWLTALRDNPILIQRPIVIRGDTAVVARQSGWQADILK